MPPNEEKKEDIAQMNLAGLPALPARYKVQRLLGQGGMGLVFEALDTQLDRAVAIKVIASNCGSGGEFEQRFMREAKALSQLDHPGIVKILNFGVTESGDYFQVLEFLDGTPLSSELAANNSMSLSRFKSIFSQVLAALEHAHEKGIIHRDIKPSNIMILQNDGTLIAKLVDFGIARLERQDGGQKLTSTGTLIGSPAYMSPEQCRGVKTDARSDIFSLATVMYEALTGSTPHTGTTPMELMYKQMNLLAPRLEEIGESSADKALGRLVDRCLLADPELRPSSAKSVREELESVLSTGASVDQYFSSEAKTQKRNLFVPSVIVVSVLALLLAGPYFLFSSKSSSMSNSKRIAQEERSIQDKYDRRLDRYRADLSRLYESARSEADFDKRTEKAKELLSKWEEFTQLETHTGHANDVEVSWHKALEQFQSIHDSYREHNVYINLAILKGKNSDFQAARLLLEKARNCQFGSPWARGELAVFMSANDILLFDSKKAIDNLDELMTYYRRIAADPSHGNPRTVLLHEKVGAHGLAESAVVTFKSLSKTSFPKHSVSDFEFLNKLAASYLEMGQTDACARVLQISDDLQSELANKTAEFAKVETEKEKLKARLKAAS
jgi:serine/threonine protein kinase